MAATERITMTMRELDRFKVIQDVADGKLKPWRSACSRSNGLTSTECRTRHTYPGRPSKYSAARYQR